MDKTELPFTVKDGMLTGPNGSWRIKDISAVFSETKSCLLQNLGIFFLLMCLGSWVAGWFVQNGMGGLIIATLSGIIIPAYALLRLMRESETLNIALVVNGVKLALWQKTYGSRSESEVKAQGEALVSLIRGAIEQSSNS